ncbi:hypothetical protein WICPIJ_004258 [Wickerhamomyces pijperi]|uniref:Pre-mRNA-processing factor 19 n=1 Tax=Wickerhamomyces pijperi TaxID=599730 RepID=A0A9P8Q8H3_WICPI|nr:hypothetical protein WICPIJ_004258 [Wickerhamomyces pijperi]
MLLEGKSREHGTASEDMALGKNRDTANTVQVNLDFWITVRISQVGKMWSPSGVFWLFDRGQLEGVRKIWVVEGLRDRLEIYPDEVEEKKKWCYLFSKVSGQLPKHPVVSPKSGLIFEQELIEQYILQNQQDPITNEPLSSDELIVIKQSPHQLPRQPQLNSVPSLLSALQNEWDSVALQLFQLTKQLDDTRKELSTALYHHDAAVRVAAKAIKERDEARKALEDLTLSISGQSVLPLAEEDEAVEDDSSPATQQTISGSIPDEIVSQITDANNKLFAIHKASKQKVNISAPLSQIDQHPRSKPFKKLISSSINTGSQIYLTSSTGITSVFDIQTSSVVKDDLIPKNKHISSILKHQDQTIIGFTTGEITINDIKLQQYSNQSIIKLLAHPSLPLIISVSANGQYGLHTLSDEQQQQQPQTVFHASAPSGVTCADIHLDGALIAMGSDSGEIYLVDLRTGELASTFQSIVEGQSDAMELHALKFGNNGFWLFSAVGDGAIEVWDLRKGKSSIIELKNTNVTKILTDKSSNLILSLSEKSIELLQYEKSSKSWSWKNQFELNIEESDFIVDGVLVNDNENNQLKLEIVTSESSIIGVDLS